MAFAKIDYGAGVAEIWGAFTLQTWERFFQERANECFGIRKSVMRRKLLAFDGKSELPPPWDKLQGAATVLKHSGDVIVWNADGLKIKSEFD